jgi:HK97 family phage portal protein
MAVILSAGALADVQPSWWPVNSYGSIRMYDQFNYDYATLYRTQPNVRTCVEFLARNVAQLGLHVFRRVSDTDRERLTEHPLAQLLALPLPPQFKVTRYRLIESLMGDLGVYFNAYWLKVRRDGAPLGLLRIPPQLVTVSGGLLPTGYEIDVGAPPKKVASEEIVHFRGYNAESAIIGLSPLETLRRVLAEEHAAGDYREHFWRNAARMHGIISRPAGAPE